MTSALSEPWTQHTLATFKRFDEALLRHVAHKLCKPRNQWPVEELLDRIVAALGNAAMIDRRLKDMAPACRQILAIIGRSRQPRWPVGSLVEILVTLGHADGLAPVVTLLESGLLLPELLPFSAEGDQQKTEVRQRLKDLESWLGRSDPKPGVLASPLVTQRVLHEDLGLTCPTAFPHGSTIHEADGLEWPLRLAVAWQQLLDAPLRRTQQGDFFKRDHDRLQADTLLSAAPTDALTPIPDPAFFTIILGSALGLLEGDAIEIRASNWPEAFAQPLQQVLLEEWRALLSMAVWNPHTGRTATDAPGNPYPSAYQVAMLLLASLPDNAWASPQAIEDWLAARHPAWKGKKPATIGVAAFLLGIAYSLRLVQANKAAGGWVIRCTPLARWLFGVAKHPPKLAAFQQTLLVQPNLEVLAYRQGLTPELIAGLSKVATWKTLGPACTLQLEPHSVYRALELGETLGSMTHLLEGHGTKALPAAVLDSLKTWSSKRERISVYPAGAIFEFASPGEMNDAIARGLRAIRLTDRLAIVSGGDAIDYTHFRLTGTRDYTLPPERCVDVDADGVTLSVDLSRSDLLLETELQRFAEPIAPLPESNGLDAKGRRLYRVTPGSIASARQQGVMLPYLQTWFAQRTGLPITAAALLLMTGFDAGSVDLKRQLVLHVANEHLADGLQQWPGTREIVKERLGPTALVVAEEDMALLTERLKELGVIALFER